MTRADMIKELDNIDKALENIDDAINKAYNGKSGNVWVSDLKPARDFVIKYRKLFLEQEI